MEKLLIIDDDRVFTRVLGRIMSSRGYIVRSANSIEIALVLAKDFQPELVLLDVNLSGQDGLSLVPCLKRINPDVLITVLTAYGNVRSAVRATRIGIFDYLTKPACADEIDYALKRCRDVRAPLPDAFMSPQEARELHIMRFFELSDRHVTNAAKLVGLQRRTLQRILKRLNFQRQDSTVIKQVTSIGRAKRMMRLCSLTLRPHNRSLRKSLRARTRSPWRIEKPAESFRS